MNNKKVVKIWIIWGIIASACCWLPLVLLSLWVISISTSLYIGYNSIYFIILAILFGSFLIYKNKSSCSSCKINNIWKNNIKYIILSILIWIIFYILIKILLLPYILPYVYKYFIN